jgi:t-SNARE complex subunit (syntaxin)
MSANVSIGDDSFYNNQTPLVDNLMRFDQLTERISENIELLKDYIDILTEYREKMGTNEDSKAMRRRTNTELSEGNDLIKRIFEDFQEMEDLKFKRRKDVDNFNKMFRRLNNTFDDYYDRFTKVLKEIHSREKIFLEIKQSMTLNRSSASDQSAVITITTDPHANQENDQKESLLDTANNLQFYASIIEERENQLQEVRKLASEMNQLAQVQAKKINEQTDDIEGLVEDTADAEKNAEGANNELSKTLKNQQKTTKKNLIITSIIVFICLLVIIILLSTS